jgi:hypothetical protein
LRTIKEQLEGFKPEAKVVDLLTRSRIQQDLRETRESYTVLSRRYEVTPLQVAVIEEDGVDAEWRVALKDFDGEPRFIVSSEGRLKNVKTGKFLKGYLSPQGRVMVSLHVDGEVTVRSLSHLVACVFLPRDTTKHYTAPLDGDPWNCAVENLKWTANEKLKPKEKLSRQDVLDIRHLFKEGLPRYELADTYNVTTGYITSVTSGKTWKDLEY